MVDEIIDEDIKRVLIDRDINTFKQAFCRIMCAETLNKSGGGGETTTITFTPSQLFFAKSFAGLTVWQGATLWAAADTI